METGTNPWNDENQKPFTHHGVMPQLQYSYLAWEPPSKVYSGKSGDNERDPFADLPQVSASGVARIKGTRLWSAAGHCFTGTDLLCENCKKTGWAKQQKEPTVCTNPVVRSKPRGRRRDR